MISHPKRATSFNKILLLVNPRGVAIDEAEIVLEISTKEFGSTG